MNLIYGSNQQQEEKEDEVQQQDEDEFFKIKKYKKKEVIDNIDSSKFEPENILQNLDNLEVFLFYLLVVV
jgi:hypothetical protein